MEKQIILKEIKSLLTEHLLERIDKVILYGSQVTGENKKYSDYDVLIVLKDEYDWRLEDKILELCYEIDLKYDILTDIKVISRKELNSIRGKQPFIRNALEKGISA